MTPLDESFALWFKRNGSSGLPWETARDVLLDAFAGGWHAKAESLKQTDLFPGTLSANEAHSAERKFCKLEEAGSIPAVGSTSDCDLANAPHDHDFLEITAEKIYEAWPVKKARGAAIVAIKKAMKKEKPEALLSAVKELAACYAAWPAEDRPFFVMCSTFMNQERWLDDRSTWRRGKQSTATRRDAF